MGKERVGNSTEGREEGEGRGKREAVWREGKEKGGMEIRRDVRGKRELNGERG